MSSVPIRILLVEDDPEDIRTIWNLLHEKSGFQYHVESVNRLPEALTWLLTHAIDAVLLDLALVTHEEERDAINALKQSQPDIAIIVITELQSEVAGLRALESGAQDYLLKEEMGTRALVRALHYAVERMRTAEQVRAVEQRLHATLNSIVDYAIVTLDSEGQVTDWSVGAEHIFRYQPAEMIGQNAERLFTPEDLVAGVPAQEMTKAREQGFSEDERWHIRKDGTRFYASGMMRPMRDASGTVYGYVKIARDATEQKRMEQQQAELLEREQASRQEMERAVASQRLFLGMVSHELRTPLAAIKGFASTLLATDVRYEAEQQQEFLQVIDQEADRLYDLIEQLLDVVQLEAGTLKVMPVATGLDALVANHMPQLQILAGSHPLVVSLPADLPMVLADPDRIGQVLANLVSNAAKFSPSDSPITLSAQRVNEVVQVSVSDQGEGIPPTQRTVVFDLFHQVRREGQPRSGRGLGLTICKGLVETHGGQIWIEEQTGPGTMISFTLPCASEGETLTFDDRTG